MDYVLVEYSSTCVLKSLNYFPAVKAKVF